MRIALTGASGLIGSALVPALRADGHSVLRLVRRAPRSPDEAEWDPAGSRLDPSVLAGTDAVVNLSGAGVGDRRWTTGYRRTLERSRVGATATLSAAVAAAEPRPRILLSASAVGWYGDTGDRAVDENAGPGVGFMAALCRLWEDATEVAETAGVRVAHLRSGLVLARGGLLGRLVPLYRLGLGGRLGSGRQFWPWISLTDEVRAIRFLLVNQAVNGPVNLTGPTPVTNAEFSRTLARVLRRPAPLPVPAFALRVALGGFADEGVLVGQRVLPRVLEQAGFTFTHRTVEAALREATGRAG
ncbi:MAG TPA: TIGR01777 family oxidoreductase [Mycobacteriales bacterium]|nr:TIGR01777 family oxidoreductase [Mycobacteriales bacterium]